MKNINANALRNTAMEVIAMCSAKKYKISDIIAHWNLCVEQSGFTGTFDIPTCYKRKASIVDDMERIALQLERIANDCDPITGKCNVEDSIKQIADVDGEPMMEVVVNSDCSAADMEAIHAEALEMNVGVELAKHIMAAMKDSDDAEAAARGCLARDEFNEINFIVHVALVARAEVLKAHAEALEMNEHFNWLRFRWGIFWCGKDSYSQQEAIDAAHEEALIMNKEIHRKYA